MGLGSRQHKLKGRLSTIFIEGILSICAASRSSMNFLKSALGVGSPSGDGEAEDSIPAEPTDVILEEKTLPRRGFTLPALLSFVAECGEENLTDLSALEVYDRFIKPQLEAADKDSWCEVMYEKGSSGAVDASWTVEDANWFVIYAHEYIFLDVVASLKHTLGEGSGVVGPDQEVVIWMDIFCSDVVLPSATSPDIKDPTWWATIYGNTIASMANVVLVMLPWEQPYTLTRARCIYELFASDVKKCRFDVAMTEGEYTRFLEMIGGNNTGVIDFLKMLAAFRSEHTELDESLSPADQRGLQEAMQDNNFDEMDASVHSMIEKWLISVLRKQIDSAGRSGAVEKAAQWMNTLGSLFRRKGKFDLAEPLLLSCLEIRKRNLGDNNVDTLTSMNNLAGLYKSQGKSSNAEALYVTCLQGRRAVLGDDHPNTLGTMNNLAGVYKNMGKFELAEPFYVSCLESTRKVLGDDHPDTLTSMNNLALLYRGMGQLAHAEPLYIMCLEGRTAVMGVEHPDTLGTMNNLALLLDDKGDFGGAEPLYARCLDVRAKVLGESHPDTLQSVDNLGSLYRRLDRLEDAEVSLPPSLSLYLSHLSSHIHSFFFVSTLTSPPHSPSCSTATRAARPASGRSTP